MLNNKTGFNCRPNSPGIEGKKNKAITHKDPYNLSTCCCQNNDINDINKAYLNNLASSTLSNLMSDTHIL